MADRYALRSEVVERLVAGRKMDEVAATRLVSDLIGAWRSELATSASPTHDHFHSHGVGGPHAHRHSHDEPGWEHAHSMLLTTPPHEEP